MTTPLIINIVVGLSYYCICSFVFLYLLIVECIKFFHENIIVLLCVFNFFMFFYVLNVRYEQYIVINTCRGMSKEIYELINANTIMKNEQEKLLLEYNNVSKKDIKIDHLYKKCKQCNKLKNITFFNKNLNSKDNFTNYCKDCNVNY